MDPSYLWQQPPHQDPGSSSEHLQTSQGLLQTNGTTRTSHSHQSSSTGWNADFGYVNGRLNPQAVQQAIPRQMYDPSWDTYGIYTDFDPNAALGIDPSTLMTAPNPSSASDPPTTIDPNLMMKSSQASLPQFISPSQTQLDPSQYTQPGYSTVYPLSAATSSLSAVMDYPVQDPMAPSTPTVSTSTRNGEPNGFHSTSEPLINQVKRILAPKKLDQDPNGTAAQLFELILPPTSEDSTSTTAITVDKEARMEILNRIRDYAPKEFWNQFGKNLRALNLLREWGRQASKKEEFTDTMMGWLQVVDKLPLTVEILIQSQLGKVVKWIVDHPPTKGESNSCLACSFHRPAFWQLFSLVYFPLAYVLFGLDESLCMLLSSQTRVMMDLGKRVIGELTKNANMSDDLHHGFNPMDRRFGGMRFSTFILISKKRFKIRKHHALSLDAYGRRRRKA
ncbi:hypothetical protein FRC16_004876 [Serendipita sp. 398]|nr:hypothetical protein FRC16_004876 [Serendipita sp. 398]